MRKNTSQVLMSAAIAGIIGASASLHAVTAMADDTDMKGHCIGANSCKGKGGCAQPGKNDCAGKNSCKGKGFLEKTKAECDKMAKKNKKNKKIHFEAMEPKKAETPKT